MYIKVHVTPDAKREEVKELSGDTLSISVKEPAEQNLANDRVRTLVALFKKIPVGKIRLVAGFRSRNKIFSIPD